MESPSVSYASIARSLGFAFSRAWMNVMFLFPFAASDGGITAIQSTVYTFESGAAGIALLCAIFLSGFLERRYRQTSYSRSCVLRVFEASLASVGIIICALFAADLLEAFWLLGVAGILAGFADIFLLVQWGTLFSRTYSESTTALEISIAFVLGGLLAYAIVPFSLVFRLSVTALFPLLSVFLLIFSIFPTSSTYIADGKTTVKALGTCPNDTADITAALQTTSSSPQQTLGTAGRRKALYTFVAKMVVAIFCFSLTLSVLRIFNTPTDQLFGELFTLSPIIAGTIFSILWWTHIHVIGQNRIHLVYRLLFTFVFLGVSSIVFVSNYAICDLLSRIGLFCCELFFLVMTVKLIAGFGISPGRTFSITYLPYIGAEFFGILVTRALEPIVGIPLVNYKVCVTMMIVLVLVRLFIFTERDIDVTQSWWLYPEDSSPATPGSLHPSEMPEGDSAVAAFDSFVSLTHARAEGFADKYHLSPREVDVLVLLILGYSRNQILDDLSISMGTCNSHITHIYQKTDVHSRDELRTLFETTA